MSQPQSKFSSIKSYVALVLCSLVLVLVIYGRNKVKQVKTAEKHAITADAIRLAEDEHKVLVQFMEEQIKDRLNGEDTDFGPSNVTTSSYLAQVYDTNEIDGDNRFGNEEIIVVGPINEISKGPDEQPIVTLKGVKSVNVLLYFDKADNPTLGALRKGDFFSATCKNTSKFIGNVQSKICKKYNINSEAKKLAAILLERSYYSSKGRGEIIAAILAASIAGELKCDIAERDCTDRTVARISELEKKGLLVTRMKTTLGQERSRVNWVVEKLDEIEKMSTKQRAGSDAEAK